MNSVKERLKYFLKNEAVFDGKTGIAEGKFESQAGIANGTVSNIGNNPTPKTLNKIKAVLPTLSITWLLSGEGEMFNKGNSESNPLTTIPDYGGVEESYMASRRNKKNTVTEFRVPLVTVKARAGYVSSYDNVDIINSLDKYAIPPGVDHVGAIWRYFEVDGDSMDPTLNSGDHVLCSQVPGEDWENIRNFYVYVLVTETNVFIKRIFIKDTGEWVLISDNETMCPQKFFDPDTLKELWVFRRLIKKSISPKKEFKIKI